MILKVQVYFFGAFGEERFEGGSLFLLKSALQPKFDMDNAVDFTDKAV